MGLYRYKSGKNKSTTWHYWYVVDSQRVYGSTGTDDYAKAKEIYVQVYNRALEGKREIKGRITLAEAVKSYLEWSKSENNKSENKESTYADKVNRSHTILRLFDPKRRLSTNYIEKEMGRACEKAAILNFTFHDLRDVFATDFYRQTRDIRKLQRVLGHASIATTERYLATLGLEDSSEAEAIFDVSVRNLLGMSLAGSQAG